MQRHLAAGISAIALLALNACGTAKPVEEQAAATPPIPDEAASPALDPRFAGIWYVSGVFPAASVRASIADPHLGAALAIGEGEVSDVNGQRCIAPGFAGDQVDAAAIGLKGGEGPWDRLVVTCDGKTFATYLRLPDRAGEGPALMQQRQEGLYLLEQAASLQHRSPSETAEAARPAGKPIAAHAMPAAEGHAAEVPATETAHAAPVELAPKVEPAPKAEVLAPIPEGPVAETHAEPAAKAHSAGAPANLPAPGTALHLASYKGQSAAKRGWKILLGEYDELDPLSPLYVTVDVPGKGEVIRLYATGAEPAEIGRICAALKAKKVYCALNP
ncbi:hypothetical protein [Dongia sp.]|uniref:hypothetical protein n=1 Tax=Dongia sp. TaxID=1977262 RepID=UPI0035B286A7